MVRSENATAAFLGPEYSWSKVALELRDVQPLSGGVRIYLPAWTISQFFVTKIALDGKQSKYKLQMAWDTKEELCRLCIEKDLIAIRPEERAGLPDEARPEITLTNSRNESHTVSKWAGVIDERFDAVYRTLLAMEERTAGQKPMPIRFSGWQKGLTIAAIAVSLLLLLLPAYGLAQWLVTSWWPARFGSLFVLLLICLALLLVAMRGLAWTERRKGEWDRSFTHPWTMMAINLLFFLALVGVAGLGEVAIGVWRTERTVGTMDGHELYALIAYTALFAAVLLLGAAGLAVTPLLRFIDERF